MDAAMEQRMKHTTLLLTLITAASLASADVQAANKCDCPLNDTGCQLVKCSGIGSTTGGGGSNAIKTDIKSMKSIKLE
jgi:hypothetical protein